MKRCAAENLKSSKPPNIFKSGGYYTAENIPAILQHDYKISFKFDAQSLLNYYKGVFSNAILERITGINQRRLQHYFTCLRKPGKAQAQKTESGLHDLEEKLLTLKL